MKTQNTCLKILILSFGIIIGFLSSNHNSAFAQVSGVSRSMPFVFDPLTKKYFIGGSTKFSLKQGEQSSLIDRIEISVDSGEYKSYEGSVEFKEEGKHTLKFRAVNPVNNWSPVQFFEVFVDLTSPTTEAKFMEDKYYKDETGYYVALKTNITLATQDNLSGVASIEYSWDGVHFSPYLKPVLIEKAGKQALHYRSLDRVGNIEPTKKLDLMVDNSSPTSVVKLLGPTKPAIVAGKTYVSDAVSFAVEASDDFSKVKQTWVTVDGQSSLYIKPIYFLQEGPHTLSYYSVDNVGNKEELKTINIYTVSSPPRTMATTVGKMVNTGGINYAKQDFQLKLDAKDNVVGLERIDVKIDQGAEFKSYLEPLQFKTLGFHTVSYRAVDRAGNLEPTRTFSLNIYEAAPETGISTAQPLVNRGGITYSPSPNVITFNVSNSPVGVQQTLLSINDGAFTPYQGPVTLTNDHKTYKLSYKSLDKLGNEETAKTVVFHMMGTAPVLDLVITSGQTKEEQVRTHYLEQPERTPSQEATMDKETQPLSKKRQR